MAPSGSLPVLVSRIRRMILSMQVFTMCLQKKSIFLFSQSRPNEHISEFSLMGGVEVDFRLFDQECLLPGDPVLDDNRQHLADAEADIP